ncbi:hypothetical protein Bca52824_027508 [Brassica carinata]|uniref:Phosphoinositide phospholipase C n=1 Tax=Brassica carinata TaxID=52824 RepID=A0A8X7VAL5_BRACI|nr:hypothetical protein Bca52824_027508 [Brassica carinata]
MSPLSSRNTGGPSGEEKKVNDANLPSLAEKEMSHNSQVPPAILICHVEESEALGHRDLIAIQSGNCKSGSEDCLRDDPEKPRRISVNEQWLENVIRTRGSDVLRFTHRNPVRIYPKGTRVDSSNYNPHVGWKLGAQMAAFNMKWVEKGTWEATMDNARNRLFDPSKRLPIETTLKVEIYTGEGWDLDFPRAHFDQSSEGHSLLRTETLVGGGFYMEGRVPVSALCSRIGTCVVQSPRLRKIHPYNDFAGKTCLPLLELKYGVRAVRLHDRSGKPYKNSRLLVSFCFDPPYMFYMLLSIISPLFS